MATGPWGSGPWLPGGVSGGKGDLQGRLWRRPGRLPSRTAQWGHGAGLLRAREQERQAPVHGTEQGTLGSKGRVPGALGLGQELFPTPNSLGRARHQEVGPRPPAHQGSRTGGQTRGSRVERKRQQLRLRRLMRAHGAPGGGAASRGRWMRGGRSSSGPAPSLRVAATRLTSALLQHRRVSAVRGPWAPPPTYCPLELPAHRPGCGTGPRPRRNLGAGPGVRGSRRWGVGGEPGGDGQGMTLTVLGEEQGVVLGQVGPLDPLLKHTQEGIAHRERADCVQDTRAPGHPRGRGLQGALGAGLCASGCDLTPAPPLPRPVLSPHLG